MKGNFLFKHVSQLFFSITLGVCFLSNSVVAHAGGLPLTNEPAIIPTWLFVLTGGVIIGGDDITVNGLSLSGAPSQKNTVIWVDGSGVRNNITISNRKRLNKLL